MTYLSYGQTHFDTLYVMANALQASKKELREMILHVKNKEKDAVFKAESVSPNKYLEKDVELDSLVVFYVPELSMFHFNINSFIIIDKIEIGKKMVTITFDTRTQFNRKGPYEGKLDFKLQSGKWNFLNFHLEHSNSKGKLMPAWK